MSELVGLVPAAGQGKRVALLPCSKEVFPVGFVESQTASGPQRRPKAIASYLLEHMRSAGVQRVFMILSKDKWDIPRYFGNGSDWGLDIAYLMQENLWGMPYALNLARQWLRHETVLFGMPDTIFSPDDAFVQLLAAHRKAAADVTLGLFPTTTPQKFGMVAYDDDLNMLYTVDKPPACSLTYMWGIACWEPSFTEFMAGRLQSLPGGTREVVLGDVFQSALDAGLRVRVRPFENGEYVDIGTPDELASAVARFSR